MHHTRNAALAAAAVVAIALTGCTASSTSTGASRDEAAPGFLAVADDSFGTGGELVVQVDYDTAEAGGLDPQAATTARTWMIESLSYETLVTMDEHLQPKPGLATSWETPSDTEYVFHLDTKATFSNGRDMTADDVVGSLQRLISTPTVWTGQLGTIASVEATGEDEVTVKLAEPHTPFLAALANTPAAILPMTEINDGSVDITTQMLGTGPLVVTGHRQDENWTFEPNTHNPKAAELGFSKLRMDIVGDETTRVAALREGSADFAVLNSVDSADALSGAKDVSVLNQQNTDFHYLMINSKSGNEALADQQVRFAINTAVDRDAINQLVFGGSTELTGVTPSPLPDSCDPTKLPSATATTAEAKAVIDGIGGLSLDLITYTDEPVLAEIAQVMQQNLAEIGVTVKIEQLDYASYSARVYADPSSFDLALSWFAGYADPSMVSTWWNPAVAGFSSVFMSGSDELNGFIADGYAAPAGKDRAAVFTELCRAADEQSEMVPLVLRPSIIGYRTDTLSPTITSAEGYGNFLRNLSAFRAAE